jgi:lipoate-protein ligase A
VATSFFAGAARSHYGAGVLFPDLIEILDPEPHDAALNMAIDEALLQHAEQPMLRVYRWRIRAVSFGYFGKIAEVSQMAADREIVRRWTGGGIVEHGDDLTYTLVVPRTAEVFRMSASDSYRAIHEAIARVLKHAGREASVASAAAEKASNACFANPVQYDLVARGAKLAGAAQRRTRWGLLHQGSIQLRPWPPSLPERLAEAFGGKVTRRSLTAETLEFARLLSAEKYGTTAWLQKF